MFQTVARIAASQVRFTIRSSYNTLPAVGPSTPFLRTLITYGPRNPPPSFPRITQEQVQLVDPETNALLPLQPLQRVFDRIDSTTHYPLLVSENPPIVRIRLIEEIVALDQAKKTQQETKKRAEHGTKEVQVPWTVADGDLQRKLELAKDILQSGDRCTIMFAPKVGGGGSKKSKVDGTRMESMVEKFERELEGLASKWRADEVLKRTRTVYWDPKAEIKKDAERKLGDHVMENKRMAEEKKEARKRKDEERRLRTEAQRAAMLQQQQQQYQRL